MCAWAFIIMPGNESMPATRRRFLHFLAGATGGVAAHALLFARQARSATGDAPLSYSHSATALGTTVTITALHEDEHLAQQAVEAAFRELDLVENIMSLYRPGSQLCRLNREKFLRDPHPYLVTVLEHARQLSENTAGAYDVTIQPLWNLFSAAKAEGRIPANDEIEAVRRSVNWRNVELHQGHIRLMGDQTLVTLNGIAQGFATDRAAAVLRESGVQQALVDAGEIGTLGRNREGDLWRIGIQHPRDTDAYVSLAELKDRCLATSGDYATPFSDDFRHHHIFDPRTGRSPTELCSVTVVAENGLLADGLSTALFVLGVEEGSALVSRTPGTSAMFIRKDGSALVTPDFPHSP